MHVTSLNHFCLRPREIMRRHAVRVAASVAVAAATQAAPLAAQDQPAVLVHGLNSSASSWNTAADRLHREFKVVPQSANLTWTKSESDQAAQLSAQVAGSGFPMYGHSNGGIVSRVFNRTYGRNDRIVTVGTPNRGAPIAINAARGSVFYWGAAIANNINDAVGFYYTYDWSRYTYVYVDQALQLMGWFGRRLPEVATFFGFVSDPVTRLAVPVLWDLDPASAYFGGGNGGLLNSAENLAREAQATSARVGIVGTYPDNIDLFFRSRFVGRPSTFRLWRTVRHAAWASSVSLYHYYLWYDYPDDPEAFWLRSNAWRWARIAVVLMDMDAAWCHQIGTLQRARYYGIYAYDLSCAPSDGVVPAASQDYPGALRRDARDVIHGEEQTHPRVYDQLYLATRDQLGVPLRPAGSVARVVVSPSSSAVAPGGTVRLIAGTYDVDGNMLNGRAVTWTSSNPSAATVAGGLVTGVANGAATIMASSEGYSGTATVTVATPPPFSSVSITGPSVVWPQTTSTWTANPSGGASPFSYVWRVGNIAPSNNRSRSFSYTSAASGSFTLWVTVTDSRGVVRSASKAVTIDDSESCGGPIACE